MYLPAGQSLVAQATLGDRTFDLSINPADEDRLVISIVLRSLSEIFGESAPPPSILVSRFVENIESQIRESRFVESSVSIVDDLKRITSQWNELLSLEESIQTNMWRQAVDSKSKNNKSTPSGPPRGTHGFTAPPTPKAVATLQEQTPSKNGFSMFKPSSWFGAAPPAGATPEKVPEIILGHLGNLKLKKVYPVTINGRTFEIVIASGVSPLDALDLSQAADQLQESAKTEGNLLSNPQSLFHVDMSSGSSLQLRAPLPVAKGGPLVNERLACDTEILFATDSSYPPPHVGSASEMQPSMLHDSIFAPPSSQLLASLEPRQGSLEYGLDSHFLTARLSIPTAISPAAHSIRSYFGIPSARTVVEEKKKDAPSDKSVNVGRRSSTSVPQADSLSHLTASKVIEGGLGLAFVWSNTVRGSSVQGRAIVRAIETANSSGVDLKYAPFLSQVDSIMQHEIRSMKKHHLTSLETGLGAGDFITTRHSISSPALQVAGDFNQSLVAFHIVSDTCCAQDSGSANIADASPKPSPAGATSLLSRQVSHRPASEVLGGSLLPSPAEKDGFERLILAADGRVSPFSKRVGLPCLNPNGISVSTLVLPLWWLEEQGEQPPAFEQRLSRTVSVSACLLDALKVISLLQAPKVPIGGFSGQPLGGVSDLGHGFAASTMEDEDDGWGLVKWRIKQGNLKTIVLVLPPVEGKGDEEDEFEKLAFDAALEAAFGSTSF